MADIPEHCKDCIETLGEAFKEVHMWLDEYAGVYWPSKTHRVHRHNLEGIAQIRNKWGDMAAEAAEIHIFKDEGCILSEKDMLKRYGVTGEKNEQR